jgi:polysaccharide biosynthesis PFTS motif protein
MTEKISSYKISTNLEFSQNIKQLLFKKVLASDLQNFERFAFNLGPNNKIAIAPTVLTKFKMPIGKKIVIVILCGYLLICYTLKLISLTNYKKNKNLTFIYSLTKEQIYRKSKLSSLYEFLNSDRFDINKKTEIWVEFKSINLKRNHKNLHVVFDIALNLYSRQFSLYKRAKVLLSIYANPFKFLSSRDKKDFVFLVLKEYIFDNAVLMHIGSQKIEKVITTQSHLMFQPLIFEMKIVEKNRFMLWYSSNSIPLEYKDSKVSRHGIPKKVYQYMKIDQHWVWNKEHSNYLTKTMKVNSCIKGPMLFYNPSIVTLNAQRIDILLFDVTPSSDHNTSRNSIHNVMDSKAFVTEIIDICVRLENSYGFALNISLKPKRKYSNLYDYDYINFLRALHSTGRLRILKYDENLYDIIKCSKIVIGYPFVSPVIVARDAKLPSFFYSSSKLLKLAPENYTDLFIQSSKKLELELNKLLVSKR